MNYIIRELRETTNQGEVMKVSELMEHLSQKNPDEGVACILWGRDDVKGVAADRELPVALTDDQADDVLELLDRHKDRSLGITWDTLEYTVHTYIADNKLK
jgi:hypothetical protein